MKNTKILISVLLLAIMCLSLFACGNKEIQVTVKISTDEYGVVSENTIGVPADDTTVLKAIAEYCAQNGFAYEYNDELDSIESIGDFKETEKNKFTYFWAYTVNGSELPGRASENYVAEGDVIVYNYTSIPTGESVTVDFIAEDKGVVETTTVVFDDGDTVIDVAEDALKQQSISYKLTDDGMGVSLVGEYQAKATPTYDEAWEFTVDGKTVSTAAGDTSVSDGNEIVFTFVRTEKAVVEEME